MSFVKVIHKIAEGEPGLTGDQPIDLDENQEAAASGVIAKVEPAQAEDLARAAAIAESSAGARERAVAA
ncbi:hypothetical protein NCC49_004811 [Naganishia albida]|nr:hypothetical protein NCC49_004811 [Naganishia albida]